MEGSFDNFVVEFVSSYLLPLELSCNKQHQQQHAGVIGPRNFQLITQWPDVEGLAHACRVCGSQNAKIICCSVAAIEAASCATSSTISSSPSSPYYKLGWPWGCSQHVPCSLLRNLSNSQSIEQRMKEYDILMS